jgi:hypothetical protein
VKAESPAEFQNLQALQYGIAPVTEAGLFFSGKKLKAFISVRHLIDQEMKITSTNEKTMLYGRIPFYSGGIILTSRLGAEWENRTSLIVRSTQGLTAQPDLLSTFVFKNKLLLGAGMRYPGITYLNLGLSPTDNILLCYSFQVPVTFLRSAVPGHEIGIIFSGHARKSEPKQKS